jgi:hypothetical protein
MKRSRFTDQQIALALQQATRCLCARLMAVVMGYLISKSLKTSIVRSRFQNNNQLIINIDHHIHLLTQTHHLSS